MTFSYVFDFKTKHIDDFGTQRTKNIQEVAQFQYGITLAAGRGTWNLNVYYALSSMFSNATYQQEPIDMYDINVGLKFYMM